MIILGFSNNVPIQPGLSECRVQSYLRRGRSLHFHTGIVFHHSLPPLPWRFWFSQALLHLVCLLGYSHDAYIPQYCETKSSGPRVQSEAGELSLAGPRRQVKWRKGLIFKGPNRYGRETRSLISQCWLDARPSVDGRAAAAG